MSFLSDKVYAILRKTFPHVRIVKEYFVSYKGQRLYVDFYIPSYLIAIETHGRQHDEFVEHFHGDAAGWRNHRRRAKLKEEWACVSGIVYVVIRDEDCPRGPKEMLSLIRRLSNVK
jgi:hypothetical protein